jgi:hypothetical protein
MHQISEEIQIGDFLGCECRSTQEFPPQKVPAPKGAVLRGFCKTVSVLQAPNCQITDQHIPSGHLKAGDVDLVQGGSNTTAFEPRNNGRTNLRERNKSK